MTVIDLALIQSPDSVSPSETQRRKSSGKRMANVQNRDRDVSRHGQKETHSEAELASCRAETTDKLAKE